MKKILLWLLVMLIGISMLVTFSLSGCKTTTTTTAAAETTTTATVETTAAATTTAATEPKTLIELGGTYKGTKLTVFAVSWPTWDELKKRIPEFEEKTGIKVEVIETPYNESLEKLMVGLSSKSGEYDLITYNTDQIAMLSFEKFIIPFDEFINSNLFTKDFNLDDFVESAINSYTIDGKIYGFPFEGGVDLMYYRTDLFKQFGFEFPKNWDEFLEIAKALTLDTNNDGKIDIYGYAIPGKRTTHATQEFIDLLRSFGGDVLDKNNNPIFNGPEGLKALQYEVDLVNKYKVTPPSVLEDTYDDQATLFLEGKLAIVTSWSYLQSLAVDSEKSKVVGKWWLAPKPGVGWSGIWALGIPTDSKNKEAAFLLAQYLTNYDAIKQLGMAAVPTTRKSVVNDPEILKKYPYMEPISKAIAQARPAFFTTRFAEVSDFMSIAVIEALTLEKTPQKALDDAAAGIKEMFKK